VGEGGSLGKEEWLRAMQQSTSCRQAMLRRSGQGSHHTATDIGRTALASFGDPKNRCAFAPAPALKNRMVSRQGPQWKVTRGTSVFAISPEQRGQCGFMEYLESCQGDTPPRNTAIYATECKTERVVVTAPDQRPGTAHGLVRS
jgi:hypothetical protein